MHDDGLCIRPAVATQSSFGGSLMQGMHEYESHACIHVISLHVTVRSAPPPFMVQLTPLFH